MKIERYKFKKYNFKIKKWQKVNQKGLFIND